MTFSIPRKPLSRRLMLRGMAAGTLVSVALPRLSAMLNEHGTAYAQGAPLAKRFGVWFWGNGNIPASWVPDAVGAGAAWTLSPQLMPYATLKENMTVITGYDVKMSGDPHHVGPAAVLSGHPHDDALNYMAPTIDHVISELIGKTSPFKALQVGVSRATANGDGHTVNYASSSGPGAPVMPEYDAKALFMRLFGQAALPPTATSDRTSTTRRRVLDVVLDDATRLRQRLGAVDARRLDQHLDGIHQLEARIMTTQIVGSPSGGTSACTPPNPDKYPARLEDNAGSLTQEQNQAMAELMTYALACDLTNVFLFQHGRPAAHYNMSFLGINKDIHDDVSHVEAGLQPTMQKAMTYWFDQGRVFLEMLQNTPDGAGNLLHNSLVYATSDVSFGFNHSTSDYPLVLFGRAGGALKGNLHHRGNNENTSNLLYSLVNFFGGNVKEFGGGEGLVSTGIPEIFT